MVNTEREKMQSNFERNKDMFCEQGKWAQKRACSRVNGIINNSDEWFGMKLK